MINRWLIGLFVCVLAGTAARQSPVRVVPADLYIFREGYTITTPFDHMLLWPGYPL